MKNKYYPRMISLSVFILFAISIFLIAPTPVNAQAQADSLAINSVTAFRHLIEENDLLVLVHYDIEYASIPTENADQLYLLRMFESGTQVGVDLPYVFGDQRGYNEGVGGFYWSASGSQPEWGGAHTIVLQGNPTVWGDVESWKVTETMGDADWSNYNTTDENRTFLYLTALSIASSIETDWGETLIVSGSLGDQLNDTGSAYFNGAIPAMSLMCPDVFSVVETYPDWPDREWNRDYADEISDTADNSPIGELVNIIERNFNVSYRAAGSLLIFIIFAVVVMLTVVRYQGQGDEGILVGLPVILMGVRLGLLSMSVWGIITLMCIMLLGYVLFFRHG